jgi:hypothetical protein
MGCQSCIHGRTNNSEIVLFFQHVVLECLLGCLLLSRFWIDDVLFRLIVFLTLCQRVRGWICTILLLCQTKVNKVDEMGLS